MPSMYEDDTKHSKSITSLIVCENIQLAKNNQIDNLKKIKIIMKTKEKDPTQSFDVNQSNRSLMKSFKKGQSQTSNSLRAG